MGQTLIEDLAPEICFRSCRGSVPATEIWLTHSRMVMTRCTGLPMHSPESSRPYSPGTAGWSTVRWSIRCRYRRRGRWAQKS